MIIYTAQNEDISPILVKRVKLLVDQAKKTTAEAVRQVCPGYICPMFFRAMLSEGVVEFEFIKADGSLRRAYGTTNMDIVSQFWTPVPGGQKTDQTCEDTGWQKFFDIEKKAWRSVTFKRLKTINYDYGE